MKLAKAVKDVGDGTCQLAPHHNWATPGINFIEFYRKVSQKKLRAYSLGKLQSNRVSGEGVGATFHRFVVHLQKYLPETLEYFTANNCPQI